MTLRCINLGCGVTMAAVLFAGCGGDDDPAAASSTDATVVSSTAVTTTIVTTTVPLTTVPATTALTTTVLTTTVPTTTVASSTTAPATTAPAGPLVFDGATFLGLVQGSPISAGVAAFGVEPVAMSALDPGPVYACTGTPDPQVIGVGGLTLVFETPEPGVEPILSNWEYVGGPVGAYTEMIAPNGIRLGDSRATLLAAFPDHYDQGTDVSVFDPTPLRFSLAGDAIEWFGVVDCLFEGDPTDG
jgi:hypothetical protein